jgi:hypothetical protein
MRLTRCLKEREGGFQILLRKFEIKGKNLSKGREHPKGLSKEESPYDVF